LERNASYDNHNRGDRTLHGRILLGLTALFALLIAPCTVALSENLAPQELSEKSAILAELSAKEKKILTQLEDLAQKINQKNQEIEQLEDEIAKKELILHRLAQNIRLREEKLKELEKRFYKRLEKLATMGKVGWINLILSPGDISSFLRKQEYVNLIFLHDQEIAKRLHQEKLALERKKSLLQKEIEKLNALKEKYQEDKLVLERLKTEKQALLEEVRRNKRLYAETLRMLQAAYAAIGKMAEELEKTRKELEATRSRVEEIKREKEENQNFIPLFEAKGSLLPPVPGTVIKFYGLEIDQTTHEKHFNKGITIAAPAMTPVVAPFCGKIRKISFVAGQGSIIFLDHGYNFLSVIGGLGKVEKELGDFVKKGEVLGYVGEAPFGKAHVYYELRYKGKPLNPLDWLDTDKLNFLP